MYVNVSSGLIETLPFVPVNSIHLKITSNKYKINYYKILPINAFPCVSIPVESDAMEQEKVLHKSISIRAMCRKSFLTGRTNHHRK